MNGAAVVASFNEAVASIEYSSLGIGGGLAGADDPGLDGRLFG